MYNRFAEKSNGKKLGGKIDTMGQFAITDEAQTGITLFDVQTPERQFFPSGRLTVYGRFRCFVTALCIGQEATEPASWNGNKQWSEPGTGEGQSPSAQGAAERTTAVFRSGRPEDISGRVKWRPSI